MKSKSSIRIRSIDTMRVIANFMVIVSHWFSWYGPAGGPVYMACYYWVGDIAYFPVPFFFIVSGYFTRHSLSQGKRGREIFGRYLKRLLPLFIFWAIVYAVIPFVGFRTLSRGDFKALAEHWNEIMASWHREPFSFLLTGHTHHLWFIISLLIGCLWVAVWSKAKKESWILPLGIIAYAVYLAIHPYQKFIIGAEIFPYPILRGFLIPITCISLGYYIRWKNIQLSLKTAFLLFLFGYLLRRGEGIFLIIFANDIVRHPFLIGTPLMSLGLFLIALRSPRILESSFLAKFGPLTLGIYAASNLVGEKVHSLDWIRHGTNLEFLGPPVIYIATIALIYPLSKVPVLKRFMSNE